MHHYNDNDPFAARWLANLVTAGRLPAGVVSQTDIKTLKGDDLVGCDQVHLFAGIGGWPLALRMAGWPDSRPVWTGSCPCQPFSVAGKRKGEADDRHLWPYFRELIAQCRPPTVFGEQVASKAGRLWLDGVRLDLEKLGYAVGSADLCAAGVNAPHIRQRLYWVAKDGGSAAGGVADDERAGLEGQAREGHPREGRKTKRSLDSGRSGRLGDTDHPGPQGRVERGNGAGQRPVGAAGMGPHGLELAQGDGGLQRGGEHGLVAQDGGAGGWMDNAAAIGRQPDAPHLGQHGEGNQQTWPGGESSDRRLDGFWSAFNLIPCGDGKARRVEPGTFPLAHGVPGRVGLLRGYGNAIVPPLAAEFVRAYLETE